MDNLFMTENKRNITLKNYDGKDVAAITISEKQYQDLEEKGFHSRDCRTFWAAVSVVAGVSLFPPYSADHISVESVAVKTLNPAIVTMLWEYSEQGAKQVTAIKFIRQCFPMGLKEAKDIWDEVKATKMKENL